MRAVSFFGDVGFAVTGLTSAYVEDDSFGAAEGTAGFGAVGFEDVSGAAGLGGAGFPAKGGGFGALGAAGAEGGFGAEGGLGAEGGFGAEGAETTGLEPDADGTGAGFCSILFGTSMRTVWLRSSKSSPACGWPGGLLGTLILTVSRFALAAESLGFGGSVILTVSFFRVGFSFEGGFWGASPAIG